jgi:hypothetical protein
MLKNGITRRSRVILTPYTLHSCKAAVQSGFIENTGKKWVFCVKQKIFFDIFSTGGLEP